MTEDKSRYLRDVKMWDFIARNSDDEITRGGWRNSYDGSPFSKEEMQEYADDVYIKLKPYLNKNETVALEIGCASGITMYRIASHVKKYIGTDMASVNLEKNALFNEHSNIRNIILKQCRADEIDTLAISSIDIVIINSVVQYFYDISYLIDVITKAIGIIDKKGIIYLGDIRDSDKKSEFESTVRQYRADNGLKALDFNKGNELFLSRDRVQGLSEIFPEITTIEVSDKLGNIKNELLKYRFDALLKVDKDGKMQV